MTLDEAMNWIDTQFARGRSVRVHRMPDVGTRTLEVWLTVVGMDETVMVCHSENRTVIDVTYSALQNYIGAKLEANV